jgi:demethylmenaquinone methyltransferase/2-methoxy-6-polyprenyl-1,4-benzoquinol methylase
LDGIDNLFLRETRLAVNFQHYLAFGQVGRHRILLLELTLKDLNHLLKTNYVNPNDRHFSLMFVMSGTLPLMPDPASVNSMFGRIAPRYDLANRLLSGGTDIRWRNRLVANVRRAAPRDILDLATGSGDTALALSRGLGKEARILGMDFCEPMLAEADRKKDAAPAGRYANVRFQPGDGLAIPLPDKSFDAVTISFGLRNMADRGRSLREMRRVLRPGGRLFVLEFSQPSPLIRPFYFFYLRRVLPRLAGWISGDRAAYVYLNQTIEQFPDRDALSAEILAAGFAHVTATPLTFGLVALHEAVS